MSLFLDILSEGSFLDLSLERLLQLVKRILGKGRAKNITRLPERSNGFQTPIDVNIFCTLFEVLALTWLGDSFKVILLSSLKAMAFILEHRVGLNLTLLGTSFLKKKKKKRASKGDTTKLTFFFRLDPSRKGGSRGTPLFFKVLSLSPSILMRIGLCCAVFVEKG
jgi:hypothetical protein